MQGNIKEITQNAKASIDNSSDTKELDNVRVSYLGKKGLVTEMLKTLQTITDIEEKKKFGKEINELKNFLETSIEEKKEILVEKDFIKTIEKNKIDITLPGRRVSRGRLNILTQVEEEIVSIFTDMGFTVAEGVELETDFYNFEALNMPDYHPARDSHDSIFVSANRLLRTHTSNMQVHSMEQATPPLAVISPGKVARRDAIDAKHSPVFHQIEGIFVDDDVSFNDLKGTLELFCKKIFGDKTKIRMRPDFFPFVEPGADLSATCVICKGAGCKTCGYEGWIEIMGAGMVHPNVFKSVNYDPEKVSGFAFGMGVERIAMIMYGITDIRVFYENDLDFLKQF